MKEVEGRNFAVVMHVSNWRSGIILVQAKIIPCPSRETDVCMPSVGHGLTSLKQIEIFSTPLREAAHSGLEIGVTIATF